MKKHTSRPLRGRGPADQLAAAAGVDLREIAKSWPTGRRRMTPGEVANRVAYIRQAARVGGLNDAAAAQLAHHLRCDPKVFLWGLRPNQGANVNTRRAGGRGAGLGNRRQSTARQRPTPERPPLYLV